MTGRQSAHLHEARNDDKDPHPNRNLAEMDETQPAGTYTVETDEELIEGLSFYAFRRIQTLIHLHVKAGRPGIMQPVNIDPKGLEDALSRDLASRLPGTVIPTS